VVKLNDQVMSGQYYKLSTFIRRGVQ